MAYTISVYDGKYIFTNDNGIVTCLRHGEEWPAFKPTNALLALLQRVEELEEAEKNVERIQSLGKGVVIN